MRIELIFIYVSIMALILGVRDGGTVRRIHRSAWTEAFMLTSIFFLIAGHLDLIFSLASYLTSAASLIYRRETFLHPANRKYRSALYWLTFVGTFFFFIPLKLAQLYPDLKLGWDLTRLAVTLILLVIGYALCRQSTRDLNRSLGTPDPSDPTRLICEQGIYRWVRHPMQLGQMCFAFASGLLFGTWFTIIYAFGVCFVLTVIIRPLEERSLFLRAGSAYEDYRNRTGAYFPRLFWARSALLRFADLAVK